MHISLWLIILNNILLSYPVKYKKECTTDVLKKVHRNVYCMVEKINSNNIDRQTSKEIDQEFYNYMGRIETRTVLKENGIENLKK